MAIRALKDSERIALEITKGKTFHVFLFGQYFKSFIHREAAMCYESVYKDDFAIIQLKGGKHV